MKAILAALILPLAALAAGGQELTVERIHVSTQADGPPVETLAWPVAQIYAVAVVRATEAPMTVRHQWFVDGTLADDIEIQVKARYHRTMSFKRSVYPGKWEVRVTDDAGTLLKSTSFEILAKGAAPAAPAPAPAPAATPVPPAPKPEPKAEPKPAPAPKPEPKPEPKRAEAPAPTPVPAPAPAAKPAVGSVQRWTLDPTPGAKLEVPGGLNLVMTSAISSGREARVTLEASFPAGERIQEQLTFSAWDDKGEGTRPFGVEWRPSGGPKDPVWRGVLTLMFPMGQGRRVSTLGVELAPL